MQLYPEVHTGVERLLREAGQTDPDQSEYELSLRLLRERGLMQPGEAEFGKPIFYGLEGGPDNDRFGASTDAVLKEADRLDNSTGRKARATHDANLTRLLSAHFRGLEKPPIRLSTAVREYLSVRGGSHNLEDLRKQTALAVEALTAVAGDKDPILQNITRGQARAYRDHWLERGNTRATAQRRITTIKAVLNLADSEHDLTNFKNPFNGLEVPKGVDGQGARDKREALTVGEIARVSAVIAGGKNQDIADLWALMVLTGARPSEITGLEREDVLLSAEVPHIHIRENKTGGVKTLSSARKVPLVAAAEGILRRRLKGLRGHQDGAQVFPRYPGTRGSSSASQLMVMAMKKAGVWARTRKVPYSTRHSNKDWFREDHSEYLADKLQGHLGNSISRGYGGTEDLRSLKEAMVKTYTRVGLIDYPRIVVSAS